MHARPYMRLAAILLVAATVGILAAPAAADTGAYLDFGDYPPFVGSTSANGTIVIGPEGVPQVNYAWGIEDNPVTVCQWALQHWSWWIAHGNPADRDVALRAADWLLTKQRPDGTWAYNFDFNAHWVLLTAPWISAMAQGEAMSVLVRAYAATTDQRYLDAATRALEPFGKPSRDGGVLGDWDGLPWYEEYPGAGEQHILNGFQYALIGLSDLADFSDQAKTMFEAGLSSLVAKVGTFDAAGVRSQYYGAFGAGRFPVDAKYRHAHAVLTRALATLSGNPSLSKWATVWEGYEKPVATPKPPPAPIVAPKPSSPPAVAAVAPPIRPGCRLGGRLIKKSGRISCGRSRRVLRHYIRHERPVRSWRCSKAARAHCRRGQIRLSVRL